jgi:DNA mismatch repair protein MutL
MPVTGPIADGAPKSDHSAQVLSELIVLGQLQNTYIVTEGSEGMYLIDQHAAHERILFEKVWSGFQSNDNRIQGLLDPVVLEIPSHLRSGLGTDLEKWNKFGFEIEHFGENSYLIRGVVDHMADRDVSRTLFQILEELDQYPSETPEWL